MYLLKISALTYLLLYTFNAQAQQYLPKWEAGIASAAVTLPHYMGSDQRYYAAAAVPYLIYRGKYLQFDRQGLHTSLLETGKLELKANLSFGLPVNNNNIARQNMPSLRWSGEIGPQLVWNFRQKRSSHMGLHLPFRAAVDIRGKYLGWVTEPTVQMAWYGLGKSRNFGLHVKAGLLLASQTYQQHYYGVEPIYATANRAAYTAQAGLHSIVLSTRFMYRYDKDIDAVFFVRARSLSGGRIANSPLVKQPLYVGVGIAMTWKLWYSKTQSTHGMH